MELSDKNIFHSDLKPSNIIFKKAFKLNIDTQKKKEEPKLIHFGFSVNDYKNIDTDNN